MLSLHKGMAVLNGFSTKACDSRRTSRPTLPPTLSPTLSHIIPLALLPPVRRRVLGHTAEPCEQLLQPLNEAEATRVANQPLPLPIQPLNRPAPHQRTSRSALPEKVLERPLSVAGLEVEPRSTPAPALTKASGEPPTESTAPAPGKASTVAVARAVLESFLAVLVVDAALFRVGQDFVSFGDILELFGGPLNLVLVLVRVVLER